MSAQHFRATQDHDNPWGLTPREAETMTLVCDTGSQKGAARAMGISRKTVEDHVRRSREKMGADGNKIHAYLIWDRFQRGRQ